MLGLGYVHVKVLPNVESYLGATTEREEAA